MTPSKIILGTMRINALSKNELSELISTALSLGINSFDCADIYAYGKCEEMFGAYLKEHVSEREKLYIQSKCGIGKGCYDFSKEHILSSVDEILKRLNTDYLDMLLLHRPDILMDEEEVASCLISLVDSGKVRKIGVSNMSRGQIELIQSAIYDKALVLDDSDKELASDQISRISENEKEEAKERYRISANQLQLSLGHTSLVNEWVNVNMGHDNAKNTNGLLPYLRLKKIPVQVWSPLQHGFFKGTFIDNEKYPKLNEYLSELSEKYDCDKTAIAFAWCLRIPGVENVIAGTTSKEHLEALSNGAGIYITREEWYGLYTSAGNGLP